MIATVQAMPPPSLSPLNSTVGMYQPEDVDSNLQKKKRRQLARLNLFVLIRVLFHYLEKADRNLLMQAKEVLRDCEKRQKEGDGEFACLAEAIQTRVRGAVGELHWNRALVIQKQFVVAQQKKKLAALKQQTTAANRRKIQHQPPPPQPSLPSNWMINPGITNGMSSLPMGGAGSLPTLAYAPSPLLVMMPPFATVVTPTTDGYGSSATVSGDEGGSSLNPSSAAAAIALASIGGGGGSLPLQKTPATLKRTLVDEKSQLNEFMPRPPAPAAP